MKNKFRKAIVLLATAITTVIPAYADIIMEPDELLGSIPKEEIQFPIFALAVIIIAIIMVAIIIIRHKRK